LRRFTSEALGEQDTDLVAFIYRRYYGIELDDAMLSQGANTSS
jgi:hypothetical protein